MKKKLSITFVIACITLFISLLANPALAWGPLGHKSICDAAWRASQDTIKTQLASSAKRMGFSTFAESCVWADSIRSNNQYNWIKPLHYMNLSRRADSVSLDYCTNTKQHRPSCVLRAIEYFNAQWKDRALSQRKRDEALLLMSHFVGDLHQPLHVAYKDDRGGTRSKVIFEGKLMSLHSLWDGDILYCGINSRWRDLGKKLFRSHRRYELNDSESLMRWADESFALTKLIYANLSKRLDDDYCDDFHPLALARLELASFRLAYLLNDTIGATNASGGKAGDEVQSAPNLFNRILALWKSILT